MKRPRRALARWIRVRTVTIHRGSETSPWRVKYSPTVFIDGTVPPSIPFESLTGDLLTQDKIDALCREVNAVGLAPGLEGSMRGILEGVMVDLGYQPKSIRADADRIVHRIRHLRESPDLADRVAEALAPMVRLADYQWIERQRHLAALLGLLQWQVDKPPPPTLWERLEADSAV